MQEFARPQIEDGPKAAHGGVTYRNDTQRPNMPSELKASSMGVLRTDDTPFKLRKSP